MRGVGGLGLPSLRMYAVLRHYIFGATNLDQISWLARRPNYWKFLVPPVQSSRDRCQQEMSALPSPAAQACIRPISDAC